MTSASAREKLYDRELEKARAKGFNFPQCNLCGLEVTPGDRWHESHVGRPKALGGQDTGIAHEACNIEDGRQVTRDVAKAKRVARAHKGCTITAAPLPFGRRSRFSKKLNGEVVPRETQGQKLARTLAEREIK